MNLIDKADVRASTKYGNRNVPKMIRGWRRLADACRAEGTPAIQAALDDVEQYIDYAFQKGAEEWRTRHDR